MFWLVHLYTQVINSKPELKYSHINALKNESNRFCSGNSYFLFFVCHTELFHVFKQYLT